LGRCKQLSGDGYLDQHYADYQHNLDDDVEVVILASFQQILVDCIVLDC
jgi:hypothetical protein